MVTGNDHGRSVQGERPGHPSEKEMVIKAVSPKYVEFAQVCTTSVQ